MNTRGILAIKNTKDLCYKCLKKSNNIKTISIGEMGYGSNFDSFGTSLQLCEDCYAESQKNVSIWDMKIVNNRYEYENQISDFLQSLPLESRELVYNSLAYGANACYTIDSQDWIDFELDELPHKKCQRYGLYSPDEIKAYEERFPNCANVCIKEYRDGSRGSYCDYGALGDSDGKCGLNVSEKCYMCSHYSPKTEEAKIINEVKEYYINEKYRLIHMLQYASTRLRELEDNVENYMDKHK